jgi:hypothetical protein
MIFQDRSLTFQEFAMNERAPLAAIQECVLQHLQDREDAAVFGAQAVNAYVDVPRMSQAVDVMSLDALTLADEIRQLIHETFQIAVRIRTVAGGAGHRIYQVRESGNRHLVDIRQVSALPPCLRLERILVPEPATLIGQKVIGFAARSKTAKGMTDLADIRRLLLTFPDLKTDTGLVAATLTDHPDALETWLQIVATDIEPEDDDAGY